MAFLPSKDTKFSGTETLLNLTADAGGSLDLDAAATVTVPTITVGSSTQKAVNDTALATYMAGQLASYATTTALDAAVAGLDHKASVRCATTANITLSGAQTVDGVIFTAGTRVLVKNQTAPAENGIYVQNAGAWPRATDADQWTELPGSIVVVEQGTTNGDTAWMITADTGGVLGTTAVTVTSFGAGTTYTDGTYLTLTGTTFDLDTSVAAVLAGAQSFTGGIKTFSGSTATTDVLKAANAVNLSTLIVNGSGTMNWTDTSGTALASVTNNGTVMSIAGPWSATGATLAVTTASAGDNDSSVASTAFVQREARRKAIVTIANGSFPYTVTVSGGLPSGDLLVTQQTAVSKAITLPAANALAAGTQITVKDGSAAGALIYPMTVNRAGTDTIDGLTSDVIDTTSEARTYVTDGVSAWYRI